ncbi:MAG: UDP-N-acetylmuramoyl-tripeptide--D-alanyl-D-alanine ligase [Propionibacteriaceae bacterium]|nr:UDP-N-acetylmuramoyl-tripeptide--D-alanyl-D-alanine ligase [Propionibacteriaceae bacterium]
MRPRMLSELVGLMSPSPSEVFGDDVLVGPDVVLDNRSATPGAVFVALPGERVDGHDFAPQAVSAGAAAVLGNHSTDTDVPHLLVSDTVAGLSALARGLVAEARARGMVSVGITGSSGKTSTKDLIAQILERAGTTVAPVGSQNNEIGVPLTACRIDDDTMFLVSEMGARGIGHIAWLTSLVPLDVAVVLNVGSAHVGEFGGLEQTAMAKGELVEALGEGGWAVLNGDDEAITPMSTRTRARLAWFGEGELPEGDLHVHARHVRMGPLSQPGFELVARRGEVEESAQVQLRVVGRHQVSNALAAAAAAIVCDVPLAEVAEALSAAQQRSSWRMDLRTRADGVLILNDAYNANPDSMAAALRTAAELVQFQRAEHSGARVIAVLGDMLELGPLAAKAHVALGRLAGDLGVDEVLAVGEYAEQMCEGARLEGVAARTCHRDDVVDRLALRAGDVVLVKGSRGVGLEAVANALTEDNS